MQENLRLMIWTAVAVFAAWFVIMTIDLHVFLHSDTDDIVSGNIPMNRTDIGTRCGEEYVNSSELVYYKLNSSGQVVYLCPQGIWPMRQRIVANVIPDAFRKSLTPQQLAKINQTYPANVPAAVTTAAPAPTDTTPPVSNNTPTTVPPEVIPQAVPAAK